MNLKIYTLDHYKQTILGIPINKETEDVKNLL